MFDVGWGELFLIGIVALIVVGPKDLPGLFRTLGQFTGRARMMARDWGLPSSSDMKDRSSLILSNGKARNVDSDE